LYANRFALGQTGNPRWTAVSNKIKDFEKKGAPVLKRGLFLSLPIIFMSVGVDRA